MVNPYSQTTSPIRLVVADDHPVFRSGLSTTLKQYSRLQVVGEASGGRELVKVVGEHRPDVVLTDINMPGMCGVEATRIIQAQFPKTNVIALSLHDGQETILQMLQAGAKGYLFKNMDEREIVQAVYAVHANGMHYCSTVSNGMVQLVAGSRTVLHQQEKQASLSNRDVQIIQLLCEEKCSKEIAAELNTTCRAVEGARQRIQEKIGARNMIGIALYAIRKGIFRVG